MVKLLALLVWVICMGWLFRYEVCPDWFVHSISGYKSLIRSKPALVDSWMKIEMNNDHIGYSHTEVELEDVKGVDQYTIHNVTMLKLSLMHDKQYVKMTSDAVLDGAYRMQEFMYAMSSRNYSMRLEGKKVADEQFDVKIRTGGMNTRQRVRIPDDAVIYSPYLELVLKELEPGDTTRLKVFDPMSMETSMASIKAVARETIPIKGEDVETTRLRIDFNNMEIGAWMDADGRIVRQKTPFGWTMEACTPDAALAYDDETFGKVDMIASSGVRVIGEIGERESESERKLRLRGASFTSEDLVTPRQAILDSGEDWVDLHITSPAWPPPPGPGPDDAAANDEDLAPYLEASTYIQSDHPDLIKRADAITRDAQTPVEKVDAIYHWVYGKVDKVPTVSLPSALDVLKNMQGDCNEHTYLFVGLARAVDVPAKVRVGIVFVDGFFGYHAWPAVHVNGQWHDLDPTLGQPVVDATHISLLEGELKNQMMLVQFLGQLEVEVIAESNEHDQAGPTE